jgi:hypothetical protein
MQLVPRVPRGISRDPSRNAAQEEAGVKPVDDAARDSRDSTRTPTRNAAEVEAGVTPDDDAAWNLDCSGEGNPELF